VSKQDVQNTKWAQSLLPKLLQGPLLRWSSQFTGGESCCTVWLLKWNGQCKSLEKGQAQGVALTGRNRTGPPCSVGRPTAHAPGPAAADRSRARLQTTDTNDRY